jgi:hypothetical protein
MFLPTILIVAVVVGVGQAASIGRDAVTGLRAPGAGPVAS